MTTIQNSAHFELVDYRDLYNKAQHDFAKLNNLVNSYDLFNFLCTVNHIHDWAKKDIQLSGVTLPDNRTGKLNIVRQLCNRAKHFKKGQGSPDTTVKKGWGTGRYGVGKWGIGEPSYTVTADGQEVSVLEICKDALTEWESFIAQNPSK